MTLPLAIIFHTKRKECLRLRSILKDHFKVTEVHNLEELTRQLSKTPPRLVLAELLLPKSKGLDLIRLIRQRSVSSEVVVLSHVQDPSYVAAAIKEGAFGFLPVTCDSDDILSISYEALEHAEVGQAAAPSPFGPIAPTSKSSRMRSVLELLPRLGRTGKHVHIAGELGTGRKTVARALHGSLPNPGVMRFVDCAPGFGRGGRQSIQPINSMLNIVGPCAEGDASHPPMHNTVCLLNFEQLSRDQMTSFDDIARGPVLVRLTNSSRVPVCFRVIAITRLHQLRDAEEPPDLAGSALFDATVLEMPPLRQRMEDLPELVTQMAERWGERYGVTPREFSTDALEALATYAWPGNILELGNVIERLTLTCTAEVVTASRIPLEIHMGAWRRGLTYRNAMERLEREFLLRVLDKAGGCRRRAAERLQLSYSTLKFRLRKVAITGRGNDAGTAKPIRVGSRSARAFDGVS